MNAISPNLTKASVVPFLIYLGGSAWLAKFPTQWYWAAYSLVVTASAIAAWKLLGPQGRSELIRPHWRISSAIFIGLLGIFAWIALSHLNLEGRLATYLPDWLGPTQRVGFDPFEQLSSLSAIAAFLTVRLAGIAIVVPLVEELFWRSFLLRWTIDPDWQKIPLGSFTWRSCLIVTLLFTLAHPEWFAAATYCLLLNAFLYWKKDLWLCIVAHGVSNLSLAIYVLVSGNWWLW